MQPTLTIPSGGYSRITRAGTKGFVVTVAATQPRAPYHAAQPSSARVAITLRAGVTWPAPTDERIAAYGLAEGATVLIHTATVEGALAVHARVERQTAGVSPDA